MLKLHYTTYFKRKGADCALLLKVVLCWIFITGHAAAQENVGIGTSTPDSSAVLELSISELSYPKGFLLPRLTTAQRDSIILPAPILLIYNTTAARFEYNAGSAAIPLWVGMQSGVESSGWLLTGNQNTDPDANFLGTTDLKDLVFKTNDSERLRITADGHLLLKSEATASELRLFAPYGNGLFYTAFKAGLQNMNITYTLPLAQGVNGSVLRNDGAGVLSWEVAGSGSVTSVGLEMPSIFDVANSPITSSGTITTTLVEQPNNTFFAGPLSSPGVPSFRAIDTSDIPALGMDKLTGTLPVSKGGTGVANITGIVTGNGTSEFTGRTITGTANQIAVTNGNGATADPNIAIATNPILPGNASTTGTLTAGTGLTVSSGTTTITPLSTGIVHSSSSGVLSSSPINLSNSDVTGTLPVSNGGTGVTTVTGLLAGNGTAPIAGRTITGTANQISVTDGNGAVANPTLAISDNPILPGIASVTLPKGATADRPATPVNGMMRYNTTTGKMETYQNNVWTTNITGSGTTNYISKFTESTTLGNSLLFDNGTTVAIGNTSPNASAAFEINSTSKGLLLPRVTTAQRDAISSPATGLTVYVTDVNPGIQYWDGTAWTRMVVVSSPSAVVVVVNKTVDESVANSTTLQDDDHLGVNMAANETWNIEAVIIAQCAVSQPDLKIAFSAPTGATMNVTYHTNIGNQGNMSSDWITTAGQTSMIDLAVPAIVYLKAVVFNGNTAGRFQLQWAQNQVNSTPTIVKAGSYFITVKGQ